MQDDSMARWRGYGVWSREDELKEKEDEKNEIEAIQRLGAEGCRLQSQSCWVENKP